MALAFDKYLSGRDNTMYPIVYSDARRLGWTGKDPSGWSFKVFDRFWVLVGCVDSGCRQFEVLEADEFCGLNSVEFGTF